MIAIIDYDGGNIKSITNVLNKDKIKFKITNNKKVIEESKKIILPGVSNFTHCMQNLKKNSVDEILKEEVINKKKPFLGICSGMQILGSESEEGNCKGLNFIEGKIIKLPVNKCNTVPHMGWNKVKIYETELTKNITDLSRFYFCHSYHFVPMDPSNIIMKTNYGLEICCGLKKDNIYGIQFHPEKSLNFGKLILSNFINNCQ